MAKMKLDAGSMKNFLINHVEKLVLGLVLLLLVLFVWAGTRLEGTEQTPVQLDQLVSRANEHVDKNTWENVATKEEYQPVTNHIQVVAKSTQPTSEVAYSTDIPLGGGVSKKIKRREDPQLFAPIEPEAVVVIAALARKKLEEETDPFAALKNTEQKKVEVKQPKKKKKKTRGGYGDYGAEMMMGPGYGEEMADMYSSGMMPGMSGMPGMPGATGATPAVQADAKKFPGFRPTGVAAMSPLGGSSVIGRQYYVVAVKALVPWRQQWEEYQRVFKDAEGFYPTRDTPKFLSFRAQRAEVPSDPNAPLNWQWAWWTESVQERTPKFGFAAYPGELADTRYTHPALTMPAPPLMMVDFVPLMLHSKVPMKPAQQVQVKQEVKPLEIETPEGGVTAEGTDAPPDVPRAPGPGMGGYAAGMAGMAGYPGMSGGYPGMSGGYPGMSGGYPGAAGYGSEESGNPYGSMGMAGMDMYGGGMMPGMMPGMSVGPPADYLLVRFFDYNIPPGKKFVYRIQLVLEDPNHPQNPQVTPADKMLDKTVQERLATVIAEEEAKKTRVFYRTTDWSEPTPPVFVEPRMSTLAGPATAPRTFDIPYGSGSVAGERTGYTMPADEELKGEVMALVWDPALAVDVPGIKTVKRGSYLNFTQNADVVEPTRLVYKVVENYPFRSDQLVLDLRGGESLPVSKPKVDAMGPGGLPSPMASPMMVPGMPQSTEEQEPEKLAAPAEYAMIDHLGRLVVRNELDDWQSYDRYAPPPPIQVQAAQSTSADYSEEMMSGGYPGER